MLNSPGNPSGAVRRDVVVPLLNAAPGLSCRTPEGDDVVESFTSRYKVHDLVWYELHQSME